MKHPSVSLAVVAHMGGSEVLVVGTITTNTYQVITNGDEPIAPILSSDAHRGGGVAVVTYQTATGTLSPGAHPGSYNGQDAWNDMLVTDDGTIMHGNRTSERRNHEGGESDIDG